MPPRPASRRAPSLPTSAAWSTRRRRGTFRSTRCWRSRGAARSLRHGGDGRGKADGRLRCRRGSQIADEYAGLVSGADVLPALGSGALPGRGARPGARGAAALARTWPGWLAARRGGRDGRPAAEPAGARIARRAGAALRRHRVRTRCSAARRPSAAPARRPPAASLRSAIAASTSAAVHEALRRHSLLEGVEPDLVAITAWAQPWVPMWVEYELERHVSSGELAGWRARRGRPRAGGAAPAAAHPHGQRARAADHRAGRRRSPAAVARWLIEENARDALSQARPIPTTEASLAALGQAADALDLLGAALDGVRAALLGLPVSARCGRVTTDGTTRRAGPARACRT